VSHTTEDAAPAPLELQRLPAVPPEEDRQRLREGLLGSPPSLPARFLYDARGSELFEQITQQPEYYPTDAEREILVEHAYDLVQRVRPAKLIELGSGYSIKTRLLIEAMAECGGRHYVAWDVSEEPIRDAAAKLTADYEWLTVSGVLGDFHRDWPAFTGEQPRMVSFLGSTIGNFDRDSRQRLLDQVRSRLETGDAFLLGYDLVKAPERLIAAYNDAAGVTAEFTLNGLRVANRTLGGDFDLDAFRYEGAWCPTESYMEMRLIAEREVVGRFAELDLELRLAPGEYLRTEVSTKFTHAAMAAELAASGLAVEHHVEDPRGDFAVALARPRSGF
jgi:L-histidine N-alpha-methyltransferase